LYEADNSLVQISLRYRKLVVTDSSLHSPAGVGVASCDTNSGHNADGSNAAIIRQIIPGMELIDVVYIMRIHEIHYSLIYAKRWYKIVDSIGRTVRVNALETTVYRDVEAVYRMIQARQSISNASPSVINSLGRQTYIAFRFAVGSSQMALGFPLLSCTREAVGIPSTSACFVLICNARNG
jgi:hypothetical protein